MGKRKTEKSAQDSGYVPVLSSTRAELLHQVEKDVSVIPTTDLVPLFVGLDVVKKKAEKLHKIAGEEIKKQRIEEGEEFGEKKHKRFTFGNAELVVERRQSPVLNEDKARKFLKRKGLLEQACDIVVTGGTDKAVKALDKLKGISYALVLQPAKIDALGLSVDELKPLFDTPDDPTWALKPKLKK